MRWRILRTLLHKEALRHPANPGAVVMVLLLLVSSLLLSIFGSKSATGGGIMPSVQTCYVHFAEDGPLIDHLRDNVPDDLVGKVKFRNLATARTDANGNYVYPHNAGAIQLRQPQPPGPPHQVWVWSPGSDPSGMAPFETWFWKESYRFAEMRNVSPGADKVVFEEECSSLAGGLDPRSGIATSLVTFALFFVCV